MRVGLLIHTTNEDQVITGPDMDEAAAREWLEKIGESLQYTGDLLLKTDWGVFVRTAVVGCFLQGTD